MAALPCTLDSPFLHQSQLPAADSNSVSGGGDERYLLINVIGQGAFGVVHRAWDRVTNEIVAIKHEIRGLSRSTLREITILDSLPRHPCIVELKEVIVDDRRRVFVVMEYVETDLHRLIAHARMTKPFTLSEIKSMMKQILEGVAFLHRHGLMHRDLKPANVLINPNTARLKICDFGLSRNLDSADGSYTPGVVSYWYRSPELLLGTKRYSNAIDLWSVGCIMVELVTREVAFPGNSEFDQLCCIGRTKCLLHEKVAPSLTAAGLDLLERLLAGDPDLRITAEEALRHTWFREFYGLLSPI